MPAMSCTSPPAGAQAFTDDAAGELTTDNGFTQDLQCIGGALLDGVGCVPNTCGTAPTGAVTYTYDANGDRTATTPTSGDAAAYAYNGLRQLTQYQLGVGSATTYAYDGDGLRVSKETAGVVTASSWGDTSTLPQLLQESTGSSTTSYIYGPNGEPLEEVVPSGVKANRAMQTWLGHRHSQ
jgi:YD repeat-containing protein